MAVINTNVASLNAQRNLNMSQSALQTSLQRLSTGLRINSAKDDAAGLAISDRMTSQIRGLNQAARNAQDGISLAQTAEGALGEISNNLQRLRELAVQSANSTNTDQDRASLQLETTQLIAEIDRISTTTKFNGRNLLDGSINNQQFQVGANAGETIALSFTSARTDKLGGSSQASLSSAINANTTALTEGDLILNGVAIGASTKSLDSASSANGDGSSIAKAAAINAKSGLTGVTAKVNETSVAGASMTAAALTGTITVNGIATGTFSTGVNAAANRAATVTALNAIADRTGVTAQDTGTDAGGVKLIAADGRNVTVAFGTLTSAATGVAAAGTYGGSFTLSSQKDIVVSGSATGTLTNSGLTAGTYSAQQAAAAGVVTTGTAFAAGDFTINGVSIGATRADAASSASATQSGIAKAAAINSISTQTGVSAKANATVAAGTAMTPAALTGTVTINGITTASITTTTNASDSRTAVVTAVNQISGQTGVTAVEENGKVKLVAADGRNVVTSFTTLTAAATGLGAAGTTYSSVTLTSAKTFTIGAGSTGADTSTTLGLQVGTYGQGATGSQLSKVDISTVDGANSAIVALDNALATVNSSRSAMGAYQNRFNSTVSNLQSTSENLSAARSRIQDADFAAETASLTRAQILQQAGTAMLAQANQLPQQVLQLLK